MLTADASPRTPSTPPPPTDVRQAVERACGRIAPTWPLDRFIAVNPLWERTHEPLPNVAGELAALSGAKLLMPRAWYAEAWREGRLRPEHLRQAAARSGSGVTEERLVALLEGRTPTPPRRALVVDVLDARSPDAGTPWRELVVQRTSQLCASYFDDGQAQLGPSRQGGLYAAWRRAAEADHGPAVLKGHRGFRAAVAALPEKAEALPALALAELGVPADEHERYLASLLLDVNGWAAWCAWLRWQARLDGRDDAHLEALLAVRLAWELVLYRTAGDGVASEWRRAMAAWPAVERTAQEARAEDWLLQDALELAYQASLAATLKTGFAAPRPDAPRLQAVFCIDVRSEVFRRALEAQDAATQTLGFAGFFGLPIEYAPAGAEHARPQLPGLLAPKLRVGDVGSDDALETQRRARLQAGHAWKAFRSGGLSSFAFVEAMGLFSGWSLLRDGRDASGPSVDDAGLSGREASARRPRLVSAVDGTPLSLDARAQLAEGMLRGMSLTRGFAPLVLLVGHGSQTRNNPHAAGLDCGACGGQTGEVNARVAAALLNDAEVRARLSERGLEVPAKTRFVAALHDTTTDDVTLFDEAGEAGATVAEARELLRRAGVGARRERSAALGLERLDDGALHRAVQARASDWAEVRPEWGLAGNASFIVAPRERTRGLHLGGRAFLHDYRHEEDRGFATLELIMTAPMVVTHWINFQYYASTVDNERYGSGNKVLHNVVGGHLGVFEGNGGDLRIGLPLQSLHDGTRWVHEPLRLSVFIEAPREAIDGVLSRHARVRQLVENGWLHLFQLDSSEQAIRRWERGAWGELGRVERAG